jgi:lipopolysaccharide export system permease protein
LIVDRYLARLVLLPTLAGFTLLVLLVSAFNAAELLRDAAYSRIPIHHVFLVVGLRDLVTAEVLLPTSLYIGVLATLNQWHRNREAYALYGAGISPTRASRPIWLLAGLVCIAVAALSLYVRPWAFATTYRLDAAAAQLSTASMQADRFYNFGDAAVLSAATIDRSADLMHDVFIRLSAPDRVRVIRATSGRIRADAEQARQYVELEDGLDYEIRDTDRADQVTRFEALRYYAPALTTSGVENQRRALPTAALIGTTQPKQRAELQWRICLPLIALLMTLIAVELARALPGSSPYARFLLGIGVYTLVFNLAAVGRTWLENGRVGAFPGMFWVPLVTAVLYVIVRRVPALSLRRPR